MSNQDSTLDWCPLYSVWSNKNRGTLAMNVGRIMDPIANEITIIRVLDLSTFYVSEVKWTDWKSWYESGKIIRYRGSFQTAS